MTAAILGNTEGKAGRRPAARPSGRSRSMGVTSGVVVEPVSLVEREKQLEVLHSLIAGPVDSGSVVLLSGEAGFGKTSLLRAFVESLDHRYRILEAACEPVGIPTAFAPLFELMDEFPGELRDDIRSGSGRAAVYSGMLDLLKSDRVVLIVEDVHWSDEATLGLIRYLGRRIAPTRSLLIVTYRSEELDLTHPMHLVIADLGPVATQIELPALTPSGVEKMTQGLDVDPGQVFAATLGNPFLVEEVIRHPESRLPSTIANAVLARAANFSPEALETLYLVALCPEGVPLDGLLELDPAAGNYVDLAVQRRLLVSSNGQVTCRHDLIRQSLEHAVPPALKSELHRSLLEQLEGLADDSPDISRLAYHSLGAADADKAIAYSLRAAGDASRGGAHRQAAHHYSNALQFRKSMAADTLGQTLLDAAHEHCLVNAFDEACDLATERIDITEGSVAKARARAWLSYFESRSNDLVASRGEAELAVEVLGEEPPSEELALALAVLAWTTMNEGDLRDAIEFGNRAVATARAAGSTRVEVHAATTVGISRVWLGDEKGRDVIEQAIRLGLESGADEWTARSMNNLAISFIWSLDLNEARRRFDRVVEFTTSRELDAWYIAAVTALATIDVAGGRWEEADRGLSKVLGQSTCRQTEVEALITAARLSAYRGISGSELMIESVIDQIRDDRDYDIVLTGTMLALQAAWIGLIDPTDALALLDEASKFEALSDDAFGRCMLGFWAQRLGVDPGGGEIPGPAGLEQAGGIAEAGEEWERSGFVIEAVICRVLVPNADLDSVFSFLTKLGAEGVAHGLRRELQRRGIKGVPRGARESTRNNPAGLTARQAEVYSLMQTGLSNAEIANELFISEKTAEHHVSAILAKLNARSRLQAVAMASGQVRTQVPS